MNKARIRNGIKIIIPFNDCEFDSISVDLAKKLDPKILGQSISLISWWCKDGWYYSPETHKFNQSLYSTDMFQVRPLITVKNQDTSNCEIGEDSCLLGTALGFTYIGNDLFLYFGTLYLSSTTESKILTTMMNCIDYYKKRNVFSISFPNRGTENFKDKEELLDYIKSHPDTQMTIINNFTGEIVEIKK